MDFTIFISFLLLSISRASSAKDTLVPGQSMNDHETLISADGSFELGFFNPNNSENRYLGIWYRNVQVKTIVWVANRDTPLFNSSGILQVNQQGITILQNSTNGVVWSSNSSRTAQSPVAQLLDSGNFAVKDGKSSSFDNIVWQSFDFPFDTLLPGMKLGWDLDKGLNRILLSQKAIGDPSQGDYSCFVDLRGFAQLFIVKGDTVETRCGPWNGLYFAGSPQLKTDTLFEYKYVANPHELYYSYVQKNSSIISRLVISEKGILERHVWIEKTQSWTLFFSVPTDQCDSYALCGANAYCNINNTPLCACLDGFVPKSPADWSGSDWSDGCVRRTHLSCHNGDGFWKHSGMQLPDTSSSWVDERIGLKECEKLCLRNCSCVAYSNSDIRGIGCFLWFDTLMDMRLYPEAGEDLYVRMAASELEKHRLSLKVKVAIIVSCFASAMGILAVGLLLHWRTRKSLQQQQQQQQRELIEKTDSHESSAEHVVELPSFNLTTITSATDNFSIYNKLGEGGFGPVYKGVLLDGREIAVKRLSETSRQGSDEFRNEVLMIAKLQHRNLVRLLGSCIQGDEKLLIYEYLPNQSLDTYIFDKIKRKLIDWDMRFNIISGIAKGLVYLHEDSRLRIIHRDLKASNVLLDSDMNPKISDFGLARIFSKDQTTENTKRVVGTFGYMAPEYAVDGHFSVKSDAFSFGVIMLELVSGERNRGFFHSDHGHNLLGHAWKLWMEQKELEMVDESVKDRCNPHQVKRCIQVGLLCVQRLPEDRPEMSTVVVMLNSEGSLPEPKQPGFYTERNASELDSSSSKEAVWSRNDITSTSMGPR